MICKHYAFTLTKRKRSRSALAVLNFPSKRPKWKQWTNEQILDTMNDVSPGQYVGVNETAHNHGVPPTMLKDRISVESSMALIVALNALRRP